MSSTTPFIDGIATFNGSSINGGIVKTAVFNGSSRNNGEVQQNATFKNNAVNAGIVKGSATFIDSSSNTNLVEGDACFKSTAANTGVVLGTASECVDPSPTPTATPAIGLPVMGGSNLPTIASQSPFTGGGNSYNFNSSNQFISFAGNSAFALGTGDFTIEWFQYQTDNNNWPRIFAIGSYPNTSIGCSIEYGTFYAWAPGANSFGSVSVKNAWHHFAIVRRSGTLYVYRNGQSIGTPKANTSNITDSNTTLYIGVENGGAPSTWFGGYITNFRWTKGLAVYTGNFTTPTSALTWTAAANPYGGSNTAAISEGFVKILLNP